MNQVSCACKRHDATKFQACDRRYTTDLGTCHDRFDSIESIRAETKRLLEEQQKTYQEKLTQQEKHFQEEMQSLAKALCNAIGREKAELTREIIDIYKRMDGSI